MSLNGLRRGSLFVAMSTIVLTLTGCIGTGDLLGDFAGTADRLGYDKCELRDIPREDQTIEAMYVCSVDVDHGVALFVFRTTTARERWSEEFGPTYRDLGADIVAHDRWAIAGTNSEDVNEIARGLGAPPASESN